MTENEKKVLANVMGLAQWLEDYEEKNFGVSGDLTGENRDLAEYFFDFHREFDNFERAAEEAELLAEIKKSSVIFLGDFHNLRQSQKVAAELLEKIASQDSSSKTLAVEFVSSGNQRSLDQYQSGKLSEKLFLKKVHFKDWNDLHHWEGYKKVLAVAKKKGLKVFGIRICQKGLSQTERDQLLAQELRVVSGLSPTDKLIVQIGDAHLAPNHLPEKMRKLPEFEDKRMTWVIIENLSQVYFSALCRCDNFHLSPILKIKEGVYQVQPAPLLTQLLSNIEYLKYASGDDEAENIWVEGDLILEIFRRWAELSKLTFDPNRLPDFHIVVKTFRLKKVLEELARAVFGGSESFLYFCSKFFIPERQPENETEQAGEKMFLDFLKGKKPVIPKI